MPESSLADGEWLKIEEDAEELIATAVNGVVRWLWAPQSHLVGQAEPLSSERFGEAPASETWASAPEHRNRVGAHGFGQDGKLLVSRWHDHSESPDRVSIWEYPSAGLRVQRTFWRSESGGWQFGRRCSLRDDASGRPVQMTFESDPRDWRSVLKIERYSYDPAGQLVHIEVDTQRGSNPGVHVEDVRYDNAGNVAVIRFRDVDGHTGIAYRRAMPGVVRSSQKLIVRESPGRIAAWAARMAPVADPVYCLALVHSYAQPSLPFSLALGCMSQRERLAADRYAPLEFSIFDPEPAELWDEAFLDACAAVSQAWRDRDDEAGCRQLLVRIAKAAASQRFAGLETTADFIVYAVDDELVDLDRNLCAARR